MTIRAALPFGPVALGLSLVLSATPPAVATNASVAVAGTTEQSRAARHARSNIAKARAALAHGRTATAIAYAERAVAFDPLAAEYRATLGQSYLKAGRFQSARDAFGDALHLDGGNGKTALQFALMQIANGDWAAARATLDAHAATIPVADRGLAIALAGDPVAAVELLGPAARTPTANAKIRQNLALSLALAGRWREAQTIVAIDVAPADVGPRILEWSMFSRPKSASDQVAALLGVRPVADAGQPQALALRTVSPAAAVAAALSTPVESPASETAEAPAQATADPIALAAAAPVRPSIAGIVFGPRAEVVQALPVSLPTYRARPATRARQVAATIVSHTPGKGNFYVQLGAYDTADIARDAWARAVRKFGALSGHVPQGVGIAANGSTYYRLSVGGFAREDAVSLCRGYRAHGGVCFVRAGAGDQTAQWAKAG